MGFIEAYRGILRYETGIYPTIPNFIYFKTPSSVFLLYKMAVYSSKAIMTTYYNTNMQKIQYVFLYLKFSELAAAVRERAAFAGGPVLVSRRCSVF